MEDPLRSIFKTAHLKAHTQPTSYIYPRQVWAVAKKKEINEHVSELHYVEKAKDYVIQGLRPPGQEATRYMLLLLCKMLLYVWSRRISFEHIMHKSLYSCLIVKQERLA